MTLSLAQESEHSEPAILAVDDDPAVLSALRRLLRPDGVQLHTAASGEEGLAVLEEHGDSLDAIISDFAMPGMDGAEFLSTARIRWPDVTRILLTGNADLPAAARAVNEGQMSYLATKPWQPEEFRHLIARAIEQRRILAENRRLRQLADEQAKRLEEWNQHLEVTVAQRTAELENANAHLNRSLLDTVRLLTTFMEQRLPDHAARCRDTARLAGRLAERAAMSAEEVRRIQVAALVHDIGLLRLPPTLVHGSPVALPVASRMQYQKHVEFGEQLLANVERLREIARWIRHHHERWDGTGYPDKLASTDIPMPSRIIGLASAFFEDRLAQVNVVTWIRQQRTDGRFDPDLVDLLDEELGGAPMYVAEQALLVTDLKPGMVLLRDVRSGSGSVILRAGQTLMRAHIDHVQKFAAASGLEDVQIHVVVSAA